MRTVPMNASDEAILEVLEEWTELLAAEDYAGALALLPPDPDQNWTPALLESDVYGYGLPGLTRKEAAEQFGSADYKITSLRACADREEIVRAPDVGRLVPKTLPNVVGMVHYEGVPLNGRRSDLTGIFYLVKVSEGEMTLRFHDLHVM